MSNKPMMKCPDCGSTRVHVVTAESFVDGVRVTSRACLDCGWEVLDEREPPKTRWRFLEDEEDA